MTPEGLVPDNLLNMVIACVVFDDGTYEGNPGSAAELKASARGIQIQLSRIGAILQEESEMAGYYYIPADLERLKMKVSALDENVESAVSTELMDRLTLPTIINVKPESRMRELVKSGLYHPKRTLLGEIDAAAKNNDKTQVTPCLERLAAGD